MATPKGSLDLIDQSTTRGYIKFNTNMYKLDAMDFGTVLDKTLSAAPGSPSEGDLYIIASTPAGGDAWEDGSTNDLANFWNGSWHFYTPLEGWRVWCSGDTPKALLVYSGSSWQTLVTL